MRHLLHRRHTVGRESSCPQEAESSVHTSGEIRARWHLLPQTYTWQMETLEHSVEKCHGGAQAGPGWQAPPRRGSSDCSTHWPCVLTASTPGPALLPAAATSPAGGAEPAVSNPFWMTGTFRNLMKIFGASSQKQ